MKWLLNTNVVSPHTVPLAIALKNHAKQSDVSYAYCSMPSDPVRSKNEYKKISGFSIDARSNKGIAIQASLDADVLIENVRDFDVIESRAKGRRPTFYVSERWFKPVRLDSLKRSEYAQGDGIVVPGFFKMFLPFAIKRAFRIVRLLRDRHNGFVYLPIGLFAARDMARLCGLFSGDLKCLLRPPKLEYDNKAGGMIRLKGEPQDTQKSRRYCLDKMRMWGYFVESSSNDMLSTDCISRAMRHEIKVLWVGRLLSWKRVDTIIRAVCEYADLRKADDSMTKISLNIYGDGPEKKHLMNMAQSAPDLIAFHPYLAHDEVRKVMKEHDVYVLASNEFEGWGAVVNEALTEGMKVIGTYESGASVTMLPESNLYHVGDWRQLMKILSKPIPDVSIDMWTPGYAAHSLVEFANDMGKHERNGGK